SAAETLDLPGMAETDAPTQSAERDPDHPHPGQWRLVHVQVSNWGTFHGTHDLAISPKGFFLTGGPGTGKSTLLDAISSLLTPPPPTPARPARSTAAPWPAMCAAPGRCTTTRPPGSSAKRCCGTRPPCRC